MAVFFLHTFTGSDATPAGIASVPPDVGAGSFAIIGANAINVFASTARPDPDSAASMEYSLPMPQADVRLRAVAIANIAGASLARELALYIRHQAGGAHYYAYLPAGGPAQIRHNNGAGVDVSLVDSPGAGWAVGETATWELEAVANVLTLRKNGTQLIQTTNGAITQAGRLRAYLRNAALDELRAEYDDAAPPPPPPPPPPAPTITAQPQPVTVTAPAPASFSVTATGEAPLSYQWRRNGTNIAGATGSSYTLTPTSTGDSGSTFSVAVTNAGGTTVSNSVSLTVNAAAGSARIPLATAAGLQLGSFSGSLTGLGLAPSGQQWRAFVHDDVSRALLASSGVLAVGAAGRLPSFVVPGLVVGTVYFVSLRRELDGASASFRVAAESAT